MARIRASDPALAIATRMVSQLAAVQTVAEQARDQSMATREEMVTLEQLAASFYEQLDLSLAQRQQLRADVDGALAGLQALAGQLDRVALTPGPPGQPGTPGAPGQPGAPGSSAYDLARGAGFTGTLTDWLTSLRGPKGDPGSPGVAGVALSAGSVNLGSTLLAGASRDITVALTRPMPADAWSPAVSIIGGTGVLGALVFDGVLSTTKTTAVVRVRNTGLSSLAATAATVHVTAFALT